MSYNTAMIPSPSVISSISATIKILPTVTNIISPTITDTKMVSNQSFDWLTFFWGGAVGSFIGALIILGLERILDVIIGKWKSHQEEKQVSYALDKEIQTNIDICNQLITTLAGSGSIIAFTKPDSMWLQTYCSKYIDFTNSDSLKLYSALYRAKNLMEIISGIQSNQQMFTATSRALGNFNNIVTEMNKNISQYAQRLKTALEEIQRNKVGNKMFDSVQSHQ